jgi:hypothetical protein
MSASGINPWHEPGIELVPTEFLSWDVVGVVARMYGIGNVLVSEGRGGVG